MIQAENTPPECEQCRSLREHGVAVLVCGGCFRVQPGVTLSKLFLANRVIARNRKESLEEQRTPATRSAK